MLNQIFDSINNVRLELDVAQFFVMSPKTDFSLSQTQVRWKNLFWTQKLYL